MRRGAPAAEMEELRQERYTLYSIGQLLQESITTLENQMLRRKEIELEARKLRRERKAAATSSRQPVPADSYEDDYSESDGGAFEELDESSPLPRIAQGGSENLVSDSVHTSSLSRSESRLQDPWSEEAGEESDA